MEKTNTNKEKDLGFQVSVSKIFPIGTKAMWEFLLSDEGIAIWIGDISVGNFELQNRFITKSGTEGKLTIFVPDCHLRFKWKPKHWQKQSTVELRVTNRKGRASIVFHQTGFFEIEKREEMRTFWKYVIEKINQFVIV
jgi:activator of HSP90 ATPase